MAFGRPQLVGMASAALGLALVLGLIIFMNNQLARPDGDTGKAASSIEVVKKEKPPQQETVRKPERAPSALPSIAPPGSAEVLPPGPAQVAAGLGPRPSSRPLPASETPHPPPVRVGAVPRSQTLIGVASPRPRPGRAVSPTLPSMFAPKADNTGGDS